MSAKRSSIDSIARVFINSNVRNLSKYPSSSHFQINLTKLTNRHDVIDLVRIIDAVIPNTTYNIDTTCNCFYFTEQSSQPSTVRAVTFMAVVPPGNYSSMNTLTSALTSAINYAQPISSGSPGVYSSGGVFPNAPIWKPSQNYQVQYDPISERCVISATPLTTSHSVLPFSIHCAPLYASTNIQSTIDARRHLTPNQDFTFPNVSLTTNSNIADLNVPIQIDYRCCVASVTLIPDGSGVSTNFSGATLKFGDASHNIVFGAVFTVEIHSRPRASKRAIISSYMLDFPTYYSNISQNTILNSLYSQTERKLQSSSYNSEITITTSLLNGIFDNTIDTDLYAIVTPAAGRSNIASILGFITSQDMGYTAIPIATGTGTSTGNTNLSLDYMSNIQLQLILPYPFSNFYNSYITGLPVRIGSTQDTSGFNVVELVNTNSAVLSVPQLSYQIQLTSTTPNTISRAQLNDELFMYPFNTGYVSRMGVYVSDAIADITSRSPKVVFMLMRINGTCLGNIQVLSNPTVTHESESVIAVAKFVLTNTTLGEFNYVCHQVNDMGWFSIKDYIRDVDRIFIDLVDQYGRQVNLRGDWSCTLEIQR